MELSLERSSREPDRSCDPNVLLLTGLFESDASRTNGWEPAACTDDCAQNCELIQNPEHCEAVPWCALSPDGCEFAAPPP